MATDATRPIPQISQRFIVHLFTTTASMSGSLVHVTLWRRCSPHLT